jgi:hypothetical protein
MMHLSWDTLNEAVQIYLRRAYPNGQVPEAVRARIAFDMGRPVAEVLTHVPFEQYTADAPFRCTVYALRLGSNAYPHLKMEIRPYPNHWGFVFWVNTHDQFPPPIKDSPDAARWRDLQNCNRDLKQAVERDWAQCDLPTFNTALQESLDRVVIGH